MASSSNNSVFIQAQGVLNEDWISRSNKKLTEVLEEIEKIEGVEIRFQRGTHVVLGTVDQLLEVQNLLLGKVAASSPKETAYRNSLRDFEAGGELESDSRDGFDSDKAFVEAEYPRETLPPTELMVDRDIWDYIESKKQDDVRQLEDVFEAVITKVEDESGVLKLILKSKSPHRACNDNLGLMLESLGELYGETFTGCVTETAQFQLPDEERELAMEHVSAQFFTVLVKKCMYSNDVLFIGPLHDARDARHQFQMVARRLVKGELRTPMDKRGHHQSNHPHEHTPTAINPNFYEEAGLSTYDQYWDGFNGPRNVNDSRTKDQLHDMHEKHDFYDEYSWEKEKESNGVLKGNSSKKTLAKSSADDLPDSFSTELDDAATDSSAMTKATKKTKKAKGHSFDLPKVTIVKQKLKAECDPSILNEPSVSFDSRKVENGHSLKAADAHHQGRKGMASEDDERRNVGKTEKKPYDSPSSSDSETHQKVDKRIQNDAERRNTEELLASQETVQNVSEIVENSEKQMNVKKDSGNYVATDNLKRIQPSALKEEVFPQPANGTIACIIDKGFHLNGCPKSGTIEISMTFEAGIQGADQPEPGRPYRGMKLKAFLPASGDGREVLRLTKSAFTARKLFQIKRNQFEGEDDIIVPNGVLFKEATDQYPDPDYLPNVIEQLKRLTE